MGRASVFRAFTRYLSFNFAFACGRQHWWIPFTNDVSYFSSPAASPLLADFFLAFFVAFGRAINGYFLCTAGGNFHIGFRLRRAHSWIYYFTIHSSSLAVVLTWRYDKAYRPFSDACGGPYFEQVRLFLHKTPLSVCLSVCLSAFPLLTTKDRRVPLPKESCVQKHNIFLWAGQACSGFHGVSCHSFLLFVRGRQRWWTPFAHKIMESDLVFNFFACGRPTFGCFSFQDTICLGCFRQGLSMNTYGVRYWGICFWICFRLRQAHGCMRCSFICLSSFALGAMWGYDGGAYHSFFAAGMGFMLNRSFRTHIVWLHIHVRLRDSSRNGQSFHGPLDYGTAWVVIHVFSLVCQEPWPFHSGNSCM